MSVNDGKELLNLIGKQVEVILVDETSVTGRVYTIDPETRNFILMEKALTTFIPFSNIYKYTVLSDEMKAVKLQDLKNIDEKHFPSTICHMSKESSEQLKLKLMEHLKKHRVPVELQGETEVVVAGVVRCRPPYDRNSCYSTNDIVLGRIQNILSTFDVS